MQRVTKHRIVCTLTVIGLGMLLILAGICAVQTISCKIHLKKLLQTAEAKGTDIKQPYFYLQPTYVPETALEEAIIANVVYDGYIRDKTFRRNGLLLQTASLTVSADSVQYEGNMTGNYSVIPSEYNADGTRKRKFEPIAAETLSDIENQATQKIKYTLNPKSAEISFKLFGGTVTREQTFTEEAETVTVPIKVHITSVPQFEQLSDMFLQEDYSYFKNKYDSCKQRLCFVFFLLLFDASALASFFIRKPGIIVLAVSLLVFGICLYYFFVAFSDFYAIAFMAHIAYVFAYDTHRPLPKLIRIFFIIMQIAASIILFYVLKLGYQFDEFKTLVPAITCAQLFVRLPVVYGLARLWRLFSVYLFGGKI